jgi:predicted Zn-dependent peptidase
VIVPLSLAALLAGASASPPADGPLSVEAIPGAIDQPRLLVARRSGAQATLRISFAVGAFDDGDAHGLTRLAQQALLESNAAIVWRDFALELHASGGSLSVTTGQRDCAFALTADSRDFPTLARELATALLSPRLDRTRMGAARARVALLRDEGTGLLPLVTSIAADDSRYVNRAIGRPEELDVLTPEQVLKHVSRLFAPANATVVVTGEFVREPMVRLLRGFRGGRAAERAKLSLMHPFQTRRVLDREMHVMALPIEAASPTSAASARALRELIDAAVWRDFREAGAVYSHSVDLVRESWVELLLVVLPGGDQTGDLAKRLRGVLAEIRAGRFSEPELARARATALRALEQEDADTAQLARALSAGGPAWHGPAVAAAVRAIDRPALLAAANTWLDPDNSAYFYFGFSR